MQPVESPLLTVNEAAAKFRIGRTLVYKLMEQGELGYVKIGRTRRVRMDEVDALIARNYIGGSHAS